ncbi:MAG: bifunctional riboflavin kinase/FAD synthetase [Turneriella sp.]
MIFVDSLDNFPAVETGSVVTMGDFDGLHTGHRVLIRETVAHARENRLLSVLVTYEPSPKKILKKIATDSRLTTYREKKDLLQESGLDIVVFYPMTAATIRISARTFLRDFLLGQLKMRQLIMGHDHHFGHNRRGNARYLEAAAPRYGFGICVIEEQLTQEKRTSSSRIRAALAEGDVYTVAEILGRPYSITGRVIRGEQNGRKLGFPTANVQFDAEKLLPVNGVYYGTALLATGRRLPAVANLGRKPTIGEFALGLEVHIPDFSGDLYGSEICFEFSGRIRGEQKFADLAALQTQIGEDIRFAKTKIVL